MFFQQQNLRKRHYNRCCPNGNNALRLGINASFLNEKPTGVGVFTREVSRRLCRMCRDTVIFTPFDDDNIPAPNRCKTPLATRGSLHLHNNILRFAYINTLLPLKARMKHIDLLYCPIMEFPFFPFMPLVVHIHDLHPLHFSSQFKLSATHFKLALNFVIRIAKRIIAPSEFVRNDMINHTGIQKNIIDVVHNGYDSSLFFPQESGLKNEFLKKYSIKGNYILFVGSLFPYKNVETLVKAFLRVKNHLNCILVIAGRKELSDRSLNQDRMIQYLDYIPQKDLPGLYSYADLLVHPSFMEGFGMTILEAMACGIPVLSSNGGSLPEVAGDAALLFDPKDSDSLSELMLSVINNKGLRDEMTKKGFDNIKRFSWDKTAEGIFESCKKAIKVGS